MFLKLHLDTSCFPILGSIKTSPNAGRSPLDKLELISNDRKQRVVQSPNGGGGLKKKLGEVHRPTNGRCGNGVVVHEVELKKPSFVKNPGGEKRKNVKGSGRFAKSGDVGGGLRVGDGNGVVKKVHSRCSTKCVSYGGCIPAILKALDEVEDLDEALRPWEDRLTNKERSIILKEQLCWKRAWEIFEWFKRKDCYEVNVIHYNIVLRILGKARKWSRVESLWDEMKVNGIAPINSTYGTLIDVYSKGGLKEEALVWLDKMSEQGMKPDEVTMGIVVQLYKKAREFRNAEDFFNKWSLSVSLRQEQEGTSTTSASGLQSSLHSHISLSSHTYNTLIDTYGKDGQLKEASEIFAMMLREGIAPTTVTFNTMIHICGNHGRLEEVASLLQKMEELRCPPDTRTYNILISLHAKHDNIDMATNYFTKMKEAHLEPDPVSYRILLYAYSIRHMVSKAEVLISEMDEKGLEIDEFTQTALTRMYIDARMLEKSWFWFMRFHLSGNLSSECFSANIDAYGERGHILEAEKVFICCLEAKKLSVLEFNVMIKAYGVGKQYGKACQLFDSMESHGVVPDKCSYSSLIQILASADMPHTAKPYLRKMQEAGLVNHCLPYCAVISSFAKLGELEMAEELYKEMVRFNVQPDVIIFGVLINAFADIGSVNEALSYADAMKKAGLPGNTVIYNSLIKLYTKVGFLNEAEETYRLLQSSEDGHAIYASNCMIDLYSERCMVEPAEKLFDSLKSKGAANEFTYAMMLCMYKKLGRFEEAIQIAMQMRELRLLTDLLSYNNVLGLYAMYGRFKEVVATFKEMIKASVQPDDHTFKSLGIVLVKSGISKQAVGNLEVSVKKDAQRGLRAWISALSSVVRLNESNYL
ncbi:pentatricopeptide repeat-containing protein At3g23020 [Malus sylvestris]|uniref:pentatricopeptide repeat-containing protein At3g23020 n=1 Tax=Malus sylvestris TaxID=3752 RepID=UPI0021AC5794|nr:pentatricopeptide repeat-containing protein At3g23020 [Malus sylvestris]